jgi:cell division protein FtsW (lipid II flippase)
MLFAQVLEFNCAFKPITDQALRPNQTDVPQRLDAALGSTGIYMSRFGLLFSALSVAIASFAVLALAGVSATVWIVQAMAVIAAAAIALAGKLLGRWHGAPLPAGLILAATLIGIAAPMFSGESDPERWISLGPLSLYVAPVLLPAFLVACSTCVYRPGVPERWALMALAGVSVLLALQPDGSQAIALLMGAAVAIARARERSRLAVFALIVAALASVWAFTRPDPLEPIAYVEGVFELALGYSCLAGVAVVASAVALIVSLHLSPSNAGRGLSAVAAYYAVLYACSVAGLTPAPLIGYGAGPWLGFGLAVGAVSWSGRRRDGNL